jgi:hypothetical protein
MPLSDLQYPVLVIDGLGYPCSFSGPGKLLRCAASALERGAYRGMRIFDGRGRGLVVRDGRRVRTVGGWGVLLLNPRVEVELDIAQELDGVTLEQVKQALCEMVDRDSSDLWEPHEEEKARIRQLRSLDEAIASYLGGEQYR